MSFVDKLLSKTWKLGDPPPNWIMAEFRKALHLMGKNGEIVHLFDTGKGATGVTFIIAMAPKSQAGALADKIGKVLQQEFPELQIRLQPKDSE
jgi:hypothetical protein